MKPLKMMLVVVAVGALLIPNFGFARAAEQAKPPATPPPATQPPAKPPATSPATQPHTTPAAPAPAPRPPAPFPEGAKYAFVDIQAIASNSIEGKSATAKIQDAEKKKTQELTDKNKALQASTTKLQQGGTVLSDAARAQLEKEIERMQRELQFAQQDAQTELGDLRTELQNAFQDKLNPVIEALRTEKGLLMIFSVRDSGIVAADPGLDLSSEVIKRFDAAQATSPKK